MKKNLSSLAKLINQFEPNKHRHLSKQQQIDLINEIFFLDAKRESRPMVHIDTGKIKDVGVRAVSHGYKSRKLQSGDRFVRVRKLNDILTAPLVADFWEPPACRTPQGRVNHAGEPLLYVADNIQAAIFETKITATDTYNLNFYKVTSDIWVTEVGFPFEDKHVNKDSIRRVIHEFLVGIFLKRGKSAYDLSNLLTKTYFNITGDGWVYPSVANNLHGDNICFSRQGRSKLELDVSFAFRNQTPMESYQINPSGGIEVSKGINVASAWEKYMEDHVTSEKPKAIQLETPIYLEKYLPAL